MGTFNRQHKQLGVADLDVCLLSRVRCGNGGETKGQKQHTGGFVIEALVNMANQPNVMYCNVISYNVM